MTCFLFDGIPEDQKEKILALMGEPKQISKGTNLYSEGLLGIIFSGKATIMRNGEVGQEIVIRKVRDGDIFGAASLFGEWEEGLSRIIADSDCLVYYLTEQNLTDIMLKYPTVSINYIRYLSDRIRFLNKKMDAFTADSTEKALLEFLMSNRCEDGSVTLDISMSELARRLDIGRSSLYRALDSLAENGFISRFKNKIIIKRG